MTTINQERLAKVQKLSLLHGSHQPDSKFCVMEAVAFVAEEPWTDHPECVPPTIGAFLRSWNDSLPTDADRDRLLKPLIPKVIGLKKSSAIEVKRMVIVADWYIRNHLPRLLRFAGLPDHAAKVEESPEIKKLGEVSAALAALDALDARAALDADIESFKKDVLALVEDTNQSMLGLVQRMIEVE